MSTTYDGCPNGEFMGARMSAVCLRGGGYRGMIVHVDQGGADKGARNEPGSCVCGGGVSSIPDSALRRRADLGKSSLFP